MVTLLDEGGSFDLPKCRFEPRLPENEGSCSAHEPTNPEDRWNGATKSPWNKNIRKLKDQTCQIPSKTMPTSANLRWPGTSFEIVATFQDAGKVERLASQEKLKMKMLKPREHHLWFQAGKLLPVQIHMSFWLETRLTIKHFKHHQTPTLFLAYWTKASNFAKTCLSGSCPCPSTSLLVTYLHHSKWVMKVTQWMRKPVETQWKKL